MENIITICAMVIGIILFLYGANYFSAVIGWTGFFLFVGGFVAEIIAKVYERIGKREVD